MLQRVSRRGWGYSQEGFTAVQAGDDQCLDQGSLVRKDQILGMFKRANLQDRATAVILRAQDSPLLRITPRFLIIDEGDTVTSVTYKSMQGSLSQG